MTIALIALDWGTSTLRAYRIDDSGAITARRTLDCGISKLPDGGFPEALNRACADWLAAPPRVPVMASGMVGSRQGWQEAPYVQCPVKLHDLALALTEVTLGDGQRLHIVAGVSREDGPMPDVMRGEETQVIGAALAADRACVVLPGTHSKWVNYRDGCISAFATHMTGELFALLRQHSLLAAMMVGDDYHPQAFSDGVGAGVAACREDGVLHRLFGVRTLALFGRLSAGAGACYLSGLLIGVEISEAMRNGYGADPIVLLGHEGLVKRYRTALELLQMQAVSGPDDAAALGLIHIARRAGLMPD